MVYKIRVLLDNDVEDEVFRDIEILDNNTLENLHNCITQAYGFDGNEMASFYISDDNWNQGEEITLFELLDETANLSNDVRLMTETTLDMVLFEKQSKLIYVYDFLNLWTFFVQLISINEENKEMSYPAVTFSVGQIPDAAPDKNFDDFNLDEFDEFDDDDFDNDGLDLDDYDDLNFNENWN